MSKVYELEFIGNNIPKYELESSVARIMPETESIDIIPKKESQKFEGLYDTVNVNGDENLVAENIKKGKSIFGIEGDFRGEEIPITSGAYLFYAGNRLDVLNQLIERCQNITDTSDMFRNCTSLLRLDLSNVDMSNVSCASRMFLGCTNLESVKLNLSSEIQLSSLFNNCLKLKDINYENWNCVASTINQMFYNCSSLEAVNLNNIDVSKIDNFQAVFYGCSKLKDLDISNWQMTGGGRWGLYINSMFSGCTSLSEESLNNILKAISTISNISASSKNLKTLGLTQEQAEICTTLNNWIECEESGWTTGY